MGKAKLKTENALCLCSKDLSYQTSNGHKYGNVKRLPHRLFSLLLIMPETFDSEQILCT